MMIRKLQPLWLAGLFLLIQPNGFGKENTLELKWSELAPVVVGHKVSAKLPSGVSFTGEAIAVRDEAMVVDVGHTSNAKALLLGQQSLPRASVSLLDLKRSGGAAGKVIGTVFGVLVGLYVSGRIVASSDMGEGAAVATVIGLTTGIAVAGNSTSA